MLHAKFQDHRTLGSFLKVLAISIWASCYQDHFYIIQIIHVTSSQGGST